MTVTVKTVTSNPAASMDIDDVVESVQQYTGIRSTVEEDDEGFVFTFKASNAAAIEDIFEIFFNDADGETSDILEDLEVDPVSFLVEKY